MQQNYSSKSDVEIRSYQNYVYEIEFIGIREGKEPLDLTMFCRNVMLNLSFDLNQFPYFFINLLVTHDLFAELQQYHRDFKYQVSIKSKRVKNIGVFDYPEYYIRDVICSSMDVESTTPPDEQFQNTPSNVPTYEINMVLFDVEHLKINKPQISKVYHDVSMKQLLSLIASKFSKYKPLITEPDKNIKEDKYTNVMIPALSPTNILKYLQAYYGIYKQGIKTFTDFKYFYLLAMDKFIEKDGEFSKIDIEILDTNIHKDLMFSRYTYIDNDNSLYRLRTYSDDIHFKPVDSYQKEIEGAKIQVLNTTNESTMINLKGTTEITPTESGSKVKKIYNNSSNNFNITDRMRELNERVEECTITFYHSLINIFSIEKKVSLRYLSVNNTNFKGDYRIKSVVHLLSRASVGELNYNIQSRCVLVKV